ncbi:MAG TPA: histidine kinase, partial [Cyanobacteria bacterium UBA12227]|nr:histidine kinase [Cyanobacteria bacterium UBA12227]
HSSLKPEQFFQTAAIQIGEVFNVDRCLVHLYLEFPTPRIPIVAEYRRPGIEPTWSLEIPVIGNPHIQQLLSQDSAIASANIEQEPLLEAALLLCRQVGLKSMLAVRTSYQGKANGLMCVHEYGEQRNWTDWEIELLEAVAVQLGIAIA